MDGTFIDNFTALGIHERTAVRILVYEIRERRPDAVRFVVDDYVVSLLLSYLKVRDYHSVLHMYGHGFISGMLEMFEDFENYEECAIIKKILEKHDDAQA